MFTGPSNHPSRFFRERSFCGSYGSDPLAPLKSLSLNRKTPACFVATRSLPSEPERIPHLAVTGICIAMMAEDVQGLEGEIDEP
jgi:hypothetical protein